jgi:hypothetical protein
VPDDSAGQPQTVPTSLQRRQVDSTFQTSSKDRLIEPLSPIHVLHINFKPADWIVCHDSSSPFALYSKHQPGRLFQGQSLRVHQANNCHSYDRHSVFAISPPSISDFVCLTTFIQDERSRSSEITLSLDVCGTISGFEIQPLITSAVTVFRAVLGQQPVSFPQPLSVGSRESHEVLIAIESTTQNTTKWVRSCSLPTCGPPPQSGTMVR